MNKQSSIAMIEFIVLMASLTALGAMATDGILPALSKMGADLGLENSNDAQFIISFIFIGFGVGQIFYGPLSDSIGRKKSVYISLVIFIIGAFISMSTTEFYTMLFGRFLQGFGASGPKIVAIAMIRDLYSGRAMAKIMSFIAMVFILVPAIAPIIGGFILKFGSWDYIFLMFIFGAFVSLFWLAFRQEETLPKQKRKILNIKTIKLDLFQVLQYKTSMAYTVVTGIVFGAFMSYLSTAEQIFVSQYSLGEDFPLYFAINAIAFGVASLVNAKLVLRLGMRYLSLLATKFFIAICLFFCIVALNTNGNPSLWVFMAFCILSFFCIGILFGNLNALAMEPMGHLAGTAAAVIGSISMFISIPIGVLIGQLYNNTITPMITSFAIVGIATFFILKWASKQTKP